MVKGVRIGEKHLYKDFKLIMDSYEIASPSPKKEIIDVPGADGVLDFTQSLIGDVKYNNRMITINLTMLDSKSRWSSKISELYNYLQGRTFKIIFDEDPSFYYRGCVQINSFQSSPILGLIVLECDVEPYKYEINSSNEDWIWDSFSFEDGIINETKNLIVRDKLEVIIYGRRKHVIPKFTCSNAMRVIFCGQTFQLPKGSYEVFDIEIVEGENKFKFIGKGTVSIFYRGGSL